MKSGLVIFLILLSLSKSFSQVVRTEPTGRENLSFYFHKIESPANIPGVDFKSLLVKNNANNSIDTLPDRYYEHDVLVIKCNDSLIAVLNETRPALGAWKYDGTSVGPGRLRSLPDRTPMAGMLVPGKTYCWYNYTLLSATAFELGSRCEKAGAEEVKINKVLYTINIDKKQEDTKPFQSWTLLDMLDKL